MALTSLSGLTTHQALRIVQPTLVLSMYLEPHLEPSLPSS
jgi:hypothetical protein